MGGRGHIVTIGALAGSGTYHGTVPMEPISLSSIG